VNAAAAHRLHAAFTGECNFDIPDLVALLRCRDEMLAAVLDPLDRPFSRERCKRDGEFFGIDVGPKPPPTSGAITRKVDSSRLRYCARWRRTM
jgi:hypothetical protein